MVAVMAMSTFAIAQTYDAYGPNSYKAQHEGDSSTEDTSTNRKGFRLGFGIGAGNYSPDLPIDDEFGVATSFEIGYAVNNQFSINYLRNTTWFSFDNDMYNDTYLAGFAGLSMNYYFYDKLETPYIVGGFGWTDLVNFDDWDAETGAGYILGIGYAMDNIEIEANYISGEIETSYGDFDQDIFQITVSYFFY